MANTDTEVVAAHEGTARFLYEKTRGYYVAVSYHAPTATSSSIANIALQEWGKNAQYPRSGATPYSPAGSKWCAYFATWCCVQAGVLSKQMGGVRAVEDYFKGIGKFGTLAGGYRPQIGDLLTMRHSGDANHIGVIVAINGDTITVCDGNSSVSGTNKKIAHIAKTDFSYSGNRSLGSGFYRTVGYCVTGGGSGSAAGQYNTVVESYYNHLQPHSCAVGTTKQVAAGERIGFMGSTGKCSGKVLEFALLMNGVPVDPVSKCAIPRSQQEALVGSKGALIGSYRVTAYFPDASPMEGGFVDMKGVRLNPESLTTVAVTKPLLTSHGGPLKYGDKIIVEGIHNYVAGKTDDICVVRDTGGGLKGIDFLVRNRTEERAWKNPTLNVYFCT